MCPDSLGALMVAWLADQRLRQVPIDLSSVSGSRGAGVLGGVYLPAL